MALIIVELKQVKKQLEAKEAEMSQAKQATYDASIMKASKSLRAQLRDVARVFCMEVWSKALSAIGISEDSELRAPDKIYYPSALCLAPSLPQLPTDPNVAPPFS